MRSSTTVYTLDIFVTVAVKGLTGKYDLNV